MTLKDIHIGKCLKQKVDDLEMPLDRICKFLNCDDREIEKMYHTESIDTFLLLRWSKLLEYDFFRLYTGHLILYAPPSAVLPKTKQSKSQNTLPSFRKNIYTQEVIDFIVEKINTNQMTINEIITKYNIPKTTLYKWLRKNNNV
jgi:hypothetical protein